MRIADQDLTLQEQATAVAAAGRQITELQTKHQEEMSAAGAKITELPATKTFAFNNTWGKGLLRNLSCRKVLRCLTTILTDEHMSFVERHTRYTIITNIYFQVHRPEDSHCTLSSILQMRRPRSMRHRQRLSLSLPILPRIISSHPRRWKTVLDGGARKSRRLKVLIRSCVSTLQSISGKRGHRKSSAKNERS